MGSQRAATASELSSRRDEHLLLPFTSFFHPFNVSTCILLTPRTPSRPSPSSIDASRPHLKSASCRPLFLHGRWLGRFRPPLGVVLGADFRLGSRALVSPTSAMGRLGHSRDRRPPYYVVAFIFLKPTTRESCLCRGAPLAGPLSI
jgi:hypothetical protein